MIREEVLEYLTRDGGKSPHVLLGFSAWKTMIGQVGSDGIGPLFLTDKDGKPVGLVQVECLTGHIVCVAGIYLFEYPNPQNPQQLLRAALDWSNVGEIHFVHTRGDMLITP